MEKIKANDEYDILSIFLPPRREKQKCRVSIHNSVKVNSMDKPRGELLEWACQSHQISYWYSSFKKTLLNFQNELEWGVWEKGSAPFPTYTSGEIMKWKEGNKKFHCSQLFAAKKLH